MRSLLECRRQVTLWLSLSDDSFSYAQNRNQAN